MLVIDNNCLNTLEGKVDNAFYVVEALVCSRLAASLLQVKAQVVDAPL